MSEQQRDGGPAFPGEQGINGYGNSKLTVGPQGNQEWIVLNQGMSLRDWFAGQALAGFMSQPDSEYAYQWTNADTGETRLLGYGCNPAGLGNWKITRTPNEGMAQAMYAVADAMIAAREWKR